MKKIKKVITTNQFVINYRRMLPYAKPYWKRAVFGLLLTIPVGSLDAVIAVFLKPYMDNVMVAKDAKYTYYIPFAIVGFTMLKGCLAYLSTYINTWVGCKITMDLKKKLYAKLLDMDIGYFDKTSSGHILFRYCQDADMAASGLIMNLKSFFSKFFSSLALIGVLLWNSWQISIIAIGVLVVLVFPIQIVRKKMKGVATKTANILAVVNTNYNESFAGNRLVTSYNLQQYQKQKTKNILEEVFGLQMKMVQYTNWLSPVMQIIISFGLATVIGYGSILIVNGTITSGNFVSFIAALLMLYTPLKTIGDKFVSVQYSFLAIERIWELFELNPDVKDKPNAKELTKVKKGIKLEQIRFEYVPGVEVVKGIDLEVKVGQMVAIVGNSGGGKTTIAHLIPRFYDVTSGTIRIDGHDIRDLTQHSLRANIATVFQDNFLFVGTIKQNVLLGRPDATDEEVKEALKHAYLEKFVDSLPNGLDTEIGERGIILSGGQKQRLAIARAFIRNASVLILDEATSALDNKAEKVVQKALDDLMKNKTVLVVAHRLSTVVNADKIVVIEQGELLEEGSHEELLAKESGTYKMLYETQFAVKTRKENEDK